MAGDKNGEAEGIHAEGIQAVQLLSSVLYVGK